MDQILNYQPHLEDDYYTILGCDEFSNVDQIVREYKVRVLECHPDKHPDQPAAVERFQKLQRAKEVLSSLETRDKYDKWRRSGISMTFDQWCALRDSAHVSMHWGSVKGKAMLTSESPSPPVSAPKPPTAHTTHTGDGFKTSRSIRPQPGWERDPASVMLKKFRNYEV